MQEDINQKVIAICMKVLRVTGQQLQQGFEKFMAEMKKAREDSMAQNKAVHERGNHVLKDLQKDGDKLTNVEITDDNIKSFERYAKKYNIQYSLKVNRQENPPHWYVFFKAKDEKVMEAAFHDYVSSRQLLQRRPSLREALKEKQMLVHPSESKPFEKALNNTIEPERFR